MICVCIVLSLHIVTYNIIYKWHNNVLYTIWYKYNSYNISYVVCSLHSTHWEKHGTIQLKPLPQKQSKRHTDLGPCYQQISFLALPTSLVMKNAWLWLVHAQLGKKQLEGIQTQFRFFGLAEERVMLWQDSLWYDCNLSSSLFSIFMIM